MKEYEKAMVVKDSEFFNKRKCVELEQETRNKQTNITELTTNSSSAYTPTKLDVTNGSYVEVSADTVMKHQSMPKKDKLKNNPSRLSVIESLAAAKCQYARNLFLYHRVRERASQQEVYAFDSQQRRASNHLFREEAKAEWCLLSRKDTSYWEAQHRCKIAHQPTIRDAIIESLD